MGARAQVNVDLILSYTIFIIFIIFLVNFVMQLSTPLTDVTSYAVQERRADAVYSELHKPVISYDELMNECNQTLPSLDHISIAYEILGFRVPGHIQRNTLLNETSGHLEFSLDDYALSIAAGNNASSTTYSVTVILPSFVTVNRIINDTLESTDSVSALSDDEFGNKRYNITLSVANYDYDRVTLNLTSPKPFIAYYEVPSSDYIVYAGSLPVKGSCGNPGSGGQYFYDDTYSSLNYAGTEYPAKISYTGWWSY